MKYATKKEARETIERYMDSTAVILAALVLAGAKFQLNDGE